MILSDAAKIYWGLAEVLKAYLGSEEIWSSEIPSIITPIMTADNAPSPVVVSASSEDTQVYLAFNQSLVGDPWYSGDWAHSKWIEIDLGVGQLGSISYYKLTSSGNNDQYPGMPAAWEVQGKVLIGDEWTPVDTRSGQVTWGNVETRTYTLSSPSANYRYFKLDLTTKEDSAYGWQILEIELWGTHN